MFARLSSPALKRATTLLLSLALASSLIGCSAKTTDSAAEDTAAQPSEVVLASTTSTQDSGLFDVLIPAFEKALPQYKVQVIAVGTGEALELGRNKDADVLLVHAKTDEEKFVADGFGTARKDVCYNDFVIVGPESDPSGVKSSADTTAAMKAIATGKAPFISRGDDSGTNKKELKLWGTSKVTTPTPETAKWYESTGQGMGETLKIASEKGGYTIADRATYLTMKDSLDLVIVREGDKGLLNQYGVIPVTGAKNAEGAQAFADWIVSADGQKVIGDFGVEKFGQQLFIPNAK